VFTEFDQEDEYEESDRDTDYASAYDEDELDDEDYPEPLEDDEPGDNTSDWQVLGDPRKPAGNSPATRGGNPWEVEDSMKAPPAGDDDKAGPASTEEEYYPEEEPEEDWEDEEDLEDPEDYAEQLDDYGDEPTDRGQHWPLSLVVVAIVALVLLAAGGYGVIQQRADTQEEIRQLQASLATAANPAEVAEMRDTLREMEQIQADSQATIDRLTLENRQLADTVAGLEDQLETQKAAATQAARTKPVAPAPPVAKPKPAAAAPAAPTGKWFVNFSSYGQRSAAENWANKLKPSAGKAIVAPTSLDGKTLYRVRIVGLSDRAQAQKVASQLQAAYGLPPLWVGSE